MADGRIFKVEKSPYLINDLTDCHEIRHDDAIGTSRPFRPLKFQKQKIQDGGGRHLEKPKNCHISAIV